MKLTQGDIRDTADYVLYLLNLDPECRRRYVRVLKLPGPTNRLIDITRYFGYEGMSVLRATKLFLNKFWNGDFGKVRLESIDAASLAKKIKDERDHVFRNPIMNRKQRQKFRRANSKAFAQFEVDARNFATAKVKEITQLEEAAALN